MYLIKHWRRVQYLANLLWSRWRHEYLSTHHARSKWQTPIKNISVGDIVLLADENAPRNQWKLARVVEVHPSADKLVRSVNVKISSKDSGSSFLDRPIHKLVPIVSV